ncbi:MAG: fibronectin type III domain-containing protein, partial [Acidobacteriota bacterium]
STHTRASNRNALRNAYPPQIYQADANGLGALVARYTYDHQGYRLSKYDAVTDVTTYYLRDEDGRVVSEFRKPMGQAASASWSKDYIYAAGRHVAMIEKDTPGVPGGLDVSTSAPGTPPFVSLTWSPSADTDLLKYQIYRGHSPPPRTDVLEYLDPSATAWTDNDPVLTEGETYTYQIRTMDQAAYTSKLSESVVVTPGDTTPPEPPGLDPPVAGDHMVQLGWSQPAVAANTPDDVWGYQVYRRDKVDPPGSPNAWIQLGGLFRMLQVTDLTAQNNITYEYHIKAIDTAGLASAASNTQEATPADITAPATPTGLYPIPGTTQVELHWQPSASSDVVAYNIYRSGSPIDVANPGASYRAQSNLTTLADTAAAVTQYFYRVSALDEAGNESAVSEEVSVLTASDAVFAPNVTNLFWGYCYDNSGLGSGGCCLPQNLVGQNCPISGVGPSVTTHENRRTTNYTWTAQGTQVLQELRVYRRKNDQEPYTLALTVPFSPSTYPLGNFSLPGSILSFREYQFAATDACVPLQQRVTAVTTDGAESISHRDRSGPAPRLEESPRSRRDAPAGGGRAPQREGR